MAELKITNEFDNKLFKRKEIEITLHSIVAPSKADIITEIAKKYSVGTENVVVDKIKGNFGSKIFNITASVYHSKEDKDSTELKKKPKKGATA